MCLAAGDAAPRVLQVVSRWNAAPEKRVWPARSCHQHPNRKTLWAYQRWKRPVEGGSCWNMNVLCIACICSSRGAASSEGAHQLDPGRGQCAGNASIRERPSQQTDHKDHHHTAAAGTSWASCAAVQGVPGTRHTRRDPAAAAAQCHAMVLAHTSPLSPASTPHTFDPAQGQHTAPNREQRDVSGAQWEWERSAGRSCGCAASVLFLSALLARQAPNTVPRDCPHVCVLEQDIPRHGIGHPSPRHAWLNAMANP